MPDVSTTYMGLPLKHPIIAGASALTSNRASIERLADGGAAAIVTKSLFEEQIELERFEFDEALEEGSCRYAEMITVRPNVEFAGPAEHLRWVREVKANAGIPVIASLNAVTRATWLEYAQLLEGTIQADVCCCTGIFEGATVVMADKDFRDQACRFSRFSLAGVDVTMFSWP